MTLAQQARDELAAGGGAAAEVVADIDAWLREHAAEGSRRATP
jgi:hypothetical protein